MVWRKTRPWPGISRKTTGNGKAGDLAVASLLLAA
jgi:hypothetical protein